MWTQREVALTSCADSPSGQPSPNSGKRTNTNTDLQTEQHVEVFQRATVCLQCNHEPGHGVVLHKCRLKSLGHRSCG